MSPGLAESEPIYSSRGDLLVPSQMALGPWFPDVQHGGAIAGLLARAFEALPSASDMRITSMYIELFRKVPMDPIQTRAQIVRDGRRIGALEAVLLDESGEKELARAKAMRIRQTSGVVKPEQVPKPEERDKPPVLDDSLAPLELGNKRFNYPSAFEVYVEKNPNGGNGYSWWRLDRHLVDEEMVTPLVRTAATVDMIMSANYILGPGYISVNPDLFISMQREAEGGWICLESKVRIDDLGSGQTDGRLYDQKGRFGRALKSLLVDKAGE